MEPHQKPEPDDPQTLFRKFMAAAPRIARRVGEAAIQKCVEAAEVLVAPDTPLRARLVLAGALAYLVLPIDAVPDFLPGGYAEDMTAIAAALASASGHITDDIRSRSKARAKTIVSTVSRWLS